MGGGFDDAAAYLKRVPKRRMVNEQGPRTRAILPQGHLIRQSAKRCSGSAGFKPKQEQKHDF